MTRISICLLLAGWLPLGAEEAPEKDPQRYVRFLAIGDMPPFRQEIRDGVRYELEPPRGSIPPREIVPVFGDDGSGESVSIQLGRISGAVPMPAGDGGLTLVKPESAAPWVSLKPPVQGDAFVVLWRRPGAATWDKPRAMVLPDDSSPGNLLLMNLSAVTVAVVLDEERLALPANRRVSRSFEPGKDRPLQIGLADTKGGLRRVHSTMLATNPGGRTLVFIYQADGPMPRQPVKVRVVKVPGDR